MKNNIQTISFNNPKNACIFKGRVFCDIKTEPGSDLQDISSCLEQEVEIQKKLIAASWLAFSHSSQDREPRIQEDPGWTNRKDRKFNQRNVSVVTPALLGSRAANNAGCDWNSNIQSGLILLLLCYPLICSENWCNSRALKGTRYRNISHLCFCREILLKEPDEILSAHSLSFYSWLKIKYFFIKGKRLLLLLLLITEATMILPSAECKLNEHQPGVLMTVNLPFAWQNFPLSFSQCQFLLLTSSLFTLIKENSLTRLSTFSALSQGFVWQLLSGI